MKFRKINPVLIYHRHIGLLIVCFVFSILFVHAQTAEEGLQKQLEDYSRNNLQEKIFIHTDKSVYVPGEIIWFKAYVVDAGFHHPIDLSKVGYIEILDNNNIPVLQTKIELQQGSGNGSFLLPATVNSGNFLLRAYTRWMRNGDPGFFFEKPLTIINTLKNFSPPLLPPAVKYDIQFFPEGGNLVNNIESKIAFKIADQYGKGIDCNGVIVSGKNDTLIAFKTLHNGIGSFEFTPKTGDSYKASIKIRKDSVITVALPSAYEKGLVMHLEDGDNQLNLTIISDNQSGEQFVYLLSHTRQKTNLAEAKKLVGNKTVFTVDKKMIGDGITTFTIFNQLKQPVCERLYFKKPATREINIKTDHESYTKRNKVTVNIAADKDDVNDLSLSVYRTDSLQSPDRTDILSYLWLTSDLKGYVESPEYYFTPGTEAGNAADNLMLTQGWRRFKWEDILSNKKPFFEFIPEYEGHIIAGKVINKQSGLPVKDVMSYLSAPARQYQFAGALSNQDGKILFNTKNFMGSEQIIVQTQNNNYRVDILNPFSENYSATLLPELAIHPSIGNQLLYQSINSQVQTAYLNDSMNHFYSPFTDTTHFFGPPQNTYYLDVYTRFTTMEEVLREYVTEVAPRKLNRKYHLYLLKNPHELFLDDPLVLVDGVPFFDMDSVMAIDPLKIQKVDVLGQKYRAGPVIADGGIVSYSTYKGNLEGIRLDPNAVIMEYEGLQLQREFYSPVYETPTQKNSRAPDFRSLLYWSPDIKINKQDKKEISFYTSDLEGNYFIMVQGVSANGKIFSKTAGFEVKK